MGDKYRMNIKNIVIKVEDQTIKDGVRIMTIITSNIKNVSYVLNVCKLTLHTENVKPFDIYEKKFSNLSGMIDHLILEIDKKESKTKRITILAPGGDRKFFKLTKKKKHKTFYSNITKCIRELLDINIIKMTKDFISSKEIHKYLITDIDSDMKKKMSKKKRKTGKIEKEIVEDFPRIDDNLSKIEEQINTVAERVKTLKRVDDLETASDTKRHKRFRTFVIKNY